MKDLITDAISKKLSTTLESIGGARALYGDPITFNGEQIVIQPNTFGHALKRLVVPQTLPG